MYLPTEEVNVLQELSLQVSDSKNASLSVEDRKCPVVQVGQYSTLSLPLRQLFSDRLQLFIKCWVRTSYCWFYHVHPFSFADEFSLLVQLRSFQKEEHSVLTLMSSDSRITLQLRISARAVIFIGTQQRHYE